MVVAIGLGTFFGAKKKLYHIFSNQYILNYRINEYTQLPYLLVEDFTLDERSLASLTCE